MVVAHAAIALTLGALALHFARTDFAVALALALLRACLTLSRLTLARDLALTKLTFVASTRGFALALFANPRSLAVTIVLALAPVSLVANAVGRIGRYARRRQPGCGERQHGWHHESTMLAHAHEVTYSANYVAIPGPTRNTRGLPQPRGARERQRATLPHK
jgi:hypothetical protein